MTTNEDLRATYDAQYAAGYAAQHTAVDTWEESLLIHRLGGDWRGKTVLEIGCGEGRLAALIAMSGAERVMAIDYSASAIHAARGRYFLDNLVYHTRRLEDVHIEDQFHVVVMQGVLEHQDNWQVFLDNCLTRLHTGGHIITSSPSFYNPRGFIWQTLRLLLNVPMSLTDLYVIDAWDMEQWAEDHHLDIELESCHFEWAHCDVMQADYRRRLPNALTDAGLDASHVEDLLRWLDKACCGRYYEPHELSGATMVYKIGPKP